MDALELSQEEQRALHSRSFNPYQLTENCFYVALGRLISVDSSTVAGLVGRLELETEEIGQPITEQVKITEALKTKLGVELKFVNIWEDYRKECYNKVNRGGPTIAKVLDLIEEHQIDWGLRGHCFTLEFQIFDKSIAHYVNLQRVGGIQWDLDNDPKTIHKKEKEKDKKAVKSGYNPAEWHIEDFQSYRTPAQIDQIISNGNLRIIIGNTRSIDTVYNSMSVSDFREAVAARGPLSKSAREELIRNTWEPSRRQWRFDIPHQGHWGMGFCLDRGQTDDVQPKWRYDVDMSHAILADSCAYSFDEVVWRTPKLTSCNMKLGWGQACVLYAT